MTKPFKPKPLEPQPLAPTLRETLHRISRWNTPSLTKQGATGKLAEYDRGKVRS
jgi:hypothetical protein